MPTSPNRPQLDTVAQASLDLGEARFRTLFEHAQVGVVIADAESVYLDANDTACRMLGYTRDEFIGLHASDIVTQTEAGHVDDALTEIHARADHRREWQFRRKDGSVFAADVVATRMPDGTLLGVINDLTAQKTRERELARLERLETERTLRSERLFSDALIDSVPGILYLYNDQGQFLRWSRNFETVTGYSNEEIARMHPRDFFSDDEKPRLEERIGEVFAKGESSVEASLLAKDGISTPFFFTGRRVQFEDQVCLVGVGVDISDRRRAEERLTESERRYRELVENANSIILRWNTDGRVMFLNEFGQQLFGYTADEIVGRLVTDTIVPPTESGGRDLRQLMKDVLAVPEAFAQNVNENVRRNGERVWISWTNRIVRDEAGRVVDFLSVGTDITEQRRAEAAIRESEAQAQAEQNKRHQAEAADRIKSAFLATMSHELRTPLNSIIGFTGIMLQGLAGPLNTEQNKQLDMVRTSARHLLALVNDVLDISKIEAGQLEVVRRCFDPRRAIDQVLTLVTPQAAAKGLPLRVHTASTLGEIMGDERRFEQILLNLLSNAIKFTDRGDVTLTADTVDDATLAGLTTGQPAIRVRVSDSGIGIKPEDLPTLFQPFRQLESGLARRHEGTGLGLAICRRLAALMGGEITAESEWGKGSVFTVVLPRHGLVAS